MLRKFPRPIKRIVIKIGSSVIATYQMKPRVAHLRSLVQQIAIVQKKGIEVILVSSGAIVLGMGAVNQKRRPTDLASLQAIAAVGQTVLMRMYDDFFKKCKSQCAQVLLTWDDFDNRERYNNARSTFQAILERGIVPVVNENDTISTEEIKFGDNDKLSALVASLVGADLLLMLSDVEGLYDMKSVEKKLFEEVREITREIEGAVVGNTIHHTKSSEEKSARQDMSKGGMAAKLQAVKIATQAQIPAIIAHGETDKVLLRVLNGERIGTFFVEKEEKLLSRKHWISFGAKPKGILVVDDGAKTVLLQGGKSLLLPGIVSWDGHFKKDEVVVVCDRNKQEIARGIVNYSVTDLNQITEKKGKPEVIHCDDLVLCVR